MAILSKYSNDDVESLLNELILVLEKNETPTDLALMVLGNAATDIINRNIAPGSRKRIAEQFGQALAASVDSRADA
ncbi:MULTISPECIES: YejL family protein [Ferrimonas]|uniref:UPF0352 protein SAMN04488540_10989 n=1 Tax=Ferrimonas sediminum TaxID=718193 RepID=A0A1G8UHN4_9GAMM|nr:MULTISPECIES: YejL family protein [Ferrimonas]USD39157.1 YejL family protein [Ferrimonas sp. SCSIO 43195]SDJ53124.1 hypothetical protein SAMN04488540_10989 [Ferrimonas sediminum]